MSLSVVRQQKFPFITQILSICEFKKKNQSFIYLMLNDHTSEVISR